MDIDAEVGGSKPRGLTTSPGLRNRAPATPATPSQMVVSPVRFKRTTVALGGQRSVPLSYGEVAPEARFFKLTIEASHAPVLFATPPGSVGTPRATTPRATRTGPEPVTFGSTIRRSSSRAHAPGGLPPSRLAGIEPTASAPRTPRATSLRHSPLLLPLGREGTIPAFWSRARCAASYTTSEWCVPGGSNSDQRGIGPPGCQLPQKHRGWQRARPARDERR